MTQTHPTLAQLIAAADACEREARAASMEDHFALRVAAAFPSLWQHPAIWASVATAHNSQWTFRLLGGMGLSEADARAVINTERTVA